MTLSKPWETSLVFRLILSFLIISLLVTALLGCITYFQSTDMLTKSVFENRERTASIKTASLTGWISDQVENVVLMAWYPVIREQTGVLASKNVSSSERNTAKGTLSQYFNLALNQTSYAEEFFIADNTGRVIISTEPGREGADLSDKSYFTEGLSRSYIHPGVRSEDEGPGITIVTPVFDLDGRRIGVLIAKISISRLDRIILEQNRPYITGETYLVDQNGEVVTQTTAMRKAGISGKVSSEGIVKAISGEKGSSLYRNYDGIPVIGVYGWVDELGLGFISEITQSEAFFPAERLAWTIIYSGVVLSFILIMGIYFIAHQIAHPVLEITKAARMVSAGDLTVSAPVLTKDEVGLLAGSFNQMTTRLKAMMEGLVQYQGRLEELVTERTRELEDAKEEAERANASKSLFLANMTHEIKTPLNAIIGFSSLLADSVKDPRSKQYIASINSAGKTLLELINDILDLSRLEAGKTALNPEPADIAGLFEDIILLLEMRAQEKGLTIRTTLPEKNPVLLIDTPRMRQILLNLVENAIKFTESGEILLTLSILPEDPHHCDLLIEVKDTGIGIPREDQERIFRAFEQQSTDISREFGGTGLGLAITHTLVSLMNGKITVRSEPGKGAIFTVFIPMIRISHTGTEYIRQSGQERFPIQVGTGTTVSPDTARSIREAGEIYLPRLKELNQKFTEEEARALADDMHRYAETHTVPELIMLSTYLSEAVSAFDMKEIGEITLHLERMAFVLKGEDGDEGGHDEVL